VKSQYGAFTLVIISGDAYRNLQEGNIKMDLQEVRGWDTDWIGGSGQGQLAGSYECGDETSGSTKCGEFLD